MMASGLDKPPPSTNLSSGGSADDHAHDTFESHSASSPQEESREETGEALRDASPQDGLTLSPSPPRPVLSHRMSSGTIIVSRGAPTVEVRHEAYAPGDARSMSPRRSMEQVERLSDHAREAMEEQARTLQANLLEIVDRVEAVKSEHEKLAGGNKFLQSYIGELMQTSKITSSSGPSSGGGGGGGGGVSAGVGALVNKVKARGRG